MAAPSLSWSVVQYIGLLFLTYLHSLYTGCSFRNNSRIGTTQTSSRSKRRPPSSSSSSSLSLVPSTYWTPSLPPVCDKAAPLLPLSSPASNVDVTTGSKVSAVDGTASLADNSYGTNSDAMASSAPESATASTPTKNHPTSPIHAAANLASSVFSQENMSMAGKIAREQVATVQQQAQDGDISLRALAFIGGVMLMAVSLFDFVGRILSFQLLTATLELFTFGLAIVVILLEAKTAFLPTTWVERVHKYALFTKFMWGRGGLYFVAGALQLSHFQHILDFVAGVWMCAVGVLMILVGRRTAMKLQALRKQLFSEDDLEEKFQRANVDGIGLDMSQFRTLTVQLGLDLTLRETESAFSHLVKSNNDRLSYEEFRQWWTESSEATEKMTENGFIFV